MSGIAGVFDPRGRPLDHALFDRVASRVAYRGPHGLRSWQGRGVAMAFAKFARTPDAVVDRQPLHDRASDTCVTFDGRLDNREDLAALLDLELTGETCDVALAAAAYRRWGTDCAARLLGDFSLAVWDGRERRLFLARDVMGLRPLFYREQDGAWWWASDQRALLELGTPAINEGYLGEHLSGRVTSVDETIYERVHRLPMAHALLVSDTVRRWRYWRPSPHGRVRHRDPREYEQQYRSLLADAVRARLRLHGRAALFLSGGIDSSSVAAEIAALRSTGRGAGADVSAFSMTIPGSAACESRVIREVLERVPLPHVTIAAQAPPEAHFRRDAASSLDLPQPPASSTIHPLRDAAVRRGCSVVITGYGGDDWFEPSFAELGDLLRRGRLIASGRWLGAMMRVPDHIPVAEIVRQGAWIALPPAAKQVVRRVLRRNPVPWWIDERFARTHHLADRLRRTPDEVAFDSLARYDMFRLATGGDATLCNDREERYTAASGLEQRHPLMDRRIIEFALSLPPEMRCSGGVSKAVMRRAMSRTLPRAVTAAPPNDDFGFLGLRALAGLGGSARLVGARPVRRGWIRAEAIARLYRTLEGGTTRALWPLCAAMGVDFWLRALEDAARGEGIEDDGHQALRAGA